LTQGCSALLSCGFSGKVRYLVPRSGDRFFDLEILAGNGCKTVLPGDTALWFGRVDKGLPAGRCTGPTRRRDTTCIQQSIVAVDLSAIFGHLMKPTSAVEDSSTPNASGWLQRQTPPGRGEIPVLQGFLQTRIQTPNIKPTMAG
jgi:hypothetical protein